MGQKDLTQKNLEYYPDVFADTVNALLYGGKQVLSPNDLQPAPTETLYPGQAKSLRNQFHDVSKYEIKTEEVQNHIDDIQLHVYDMRKLPKQVRMHFTSDMRIVVDCLAEKGEFKPTK